MNQGNAGDNLGFGKAYVFEFDGVEWTEVAQLTPSDTEHDKEFGNDVAIDGETIVVGAGQDGGGIGVGSGAVYVFERIDGVWTQKAKLTASDAAANDYFGTGLSISGNMIVVGAYNHDDSGSDSGSAYIFEKPLDGWVDMTQTQKLLVSDATGGDRCGHSSAIDGNTVVIGCDQINAGPGKAYIFERQSGIWVETATLTASDAEMEDSFVYDVAIRGETVIVGAFRDDDEEINSGSAYVFVRPDTGWVNTTQTCKLRALAPVAHDNFGFSVSISIFDTVLVGANAEEDSSSPGSVYLFEQVLDVCVDMTETTKLFAFDSAPGDRFGNSVSIDTNITFIGAHRDDDNGTGSGSAYVFRCLPPDMDGDGIPDDVDACPDSDLSDTIVIDGCDTGVINQLFDDGCTMADRIAQCTGAAVNNAVFVCCVAHMTNKWKDSGLISGATKGPIQSCAAQAESP